MKAHRGNSRKTERTIRLWSLPQARQALPYLMSILRSMREHRLEQAAAERSVRRLDKRPGRPDRITLIARAEAVRLAQLAGERFDAAAAELDAMDVFCLDPIQGEAAIPFQQGGNLAWFLVDLFAEAPMDFWRFHEDDPGLRRPITEVQADPESQSVVV